jgi:trimeric autotransporter adhesin
MLECRTRPALWPALLQGRTAAHITTTNNNNNANNNNNSNPAIVAAEDANVGNAAVVENAVPPVAVASAVAAADDEHELAELAAATATAAINAAMQELIMANEAPVPPAHTGESHNSMINSSTSHTAPAIPSTPSGDVMATSYGLGAGESPCINEVFPGADDDDEMLVVGGERTVLRLGTEELVGTSNLSLASVSASYDDAAASTASTSTTAAVAESDGTACSDSDSATCSSSSSSTITSTTDHMSASTSTCAYSSSSSSTSTSNGSSSNELTLSVPTQLHSRLQRTLSCVELYMLYVWLMACQKSISLSSVTQYCYCKLKQRLQMYHWPV